MRRRSPPSLLPLRLLAPLLALLALALPSEVQGQQDLAAVQAQLEVERRLLNADLRRLADARLVDADASEELRLAAELLDEALVADEPAAGELERLETELLAAEAVAAATGRQLDQLRRRALERLRRIEELGREESRLLGGLPAPADPVSGRWRVEIASPPTRGSFELRLDGALVSGSYTFEDGESGSLRGTYASQRLRLERIDAERGLDGIFEGTLDPVRQTVRGFWSPSLLSDGAPGGTSWTAVRQSPADRGAEEEGAEGEPIDVFETEENESEGG